ncbi:hypothetical protein HDV00_009085, partial [Rhizophlyctis rosea]
MTDQLKSSSSAASDSASDTTAIALQFTKDMLDPANITSIANELVQSGIPSNQSTALLQKVPQPLPTVNAPSNPAEELELTWKSKVFRCPQEGEYTFWNLDHHGESKASWGREFAKRRAAGELDNALGKFFLVGNGLFEMYDTKEAVKRAFREKKLKGDEAIVFENWAGNMGKVEEMAGFAGYTWRGGAAAVRKPFGLVDMRMQESPKFTSSEMPTLVDRRVTTSVCPSAIANNDVWGFAANAVKIVVTMGAWFSVKK